MPAGDCARRLCLTQLFWSESVAAGATAEAFSLFARDWFLPLVWVDTGTHADVSIASVTYKADPLFESGNTTAIEPDVALVVDATVSAAEVAETLREGAGPLLESVRLFDVYTGEQIGEGKKSLAFAMRFRAPDRTLTDAEVAEAREAAVALAVERHGAVHRS